MNKVRGIFLLGLVLCFIGCEKEEGLYDFVPPVIDTASTKLELGMGSDYSNQIFLELESSNTHINDFMVWDLALPSDITKLNIRMNDANAAYLTPSTFNDIKAKEDLPISGWEIDESCGSKDSSAIGNWYTEENGVFKSRKLVYILDRGELAVGERYYKFQIKEMNKDSYVIAYGVFNSSYFMTKTIKIDKNKNYNYFNLSKGSVENIEYYDNNQWDLVFRPYRHVFLDEVPVLQYVVVGTLINPNKVKVYECTNVVYDDIDYTFAKSSIAYSSLWDVIGFDWKEFDRNTNKYAIRSNLSYVIQDTKGDYYKLRFLNFYNKFGEKGFPRIEYIKL